MADMLSAGLGLAIYAGIRRRTTDLSGVEVGRGWSRRAAAPARGRREPGLSRLSGQAERQEQVAHLDQIPVVEPCRLHRSPIDVGATAGV